MAKSEFSCSENIVHEDAVAEVRGKMHDGEMLDKLMVDLCIGCGTCSYVCPAKRPVTQTMNLAKAVWQKNKNGGKK